MSDTAQVEVVATVKESSASYRKTYHTRDEPHPERARRLGIGDQGLELDRCLVETTGVDELGEHGRCLRLGRRSRCRSGRKAIGEHLLECSLVGSVVVVVVVVVVSGRLGAAGRRGRALAAAGVEREQVKVVEGQELCVRLSSLSLSLSLGADKVLRLRAVLVARSRD